MRRFRLGSFAGVFALLAVGLLLATGSSAYPRPDVPLQLEPFVAGLGKVTAVTHAGDGSERLFVAEKPGYIRIVKDGALLPELFLDIQSPVRARGNEQGLLGQAFHPDYAHNGLFFVHYTDRDGAVTIARFRVSASNPDWADPESGEILIVIPKTKTGEDHNGGMMQFGPDGYLYIAVGDGGASAEPQRNAQRTDVLLGKILRIDVDREENGKHYAIPSDNPFDGVDGAMPEIWAYGLRNPWRFSIDRGTGDFIIADVGLGQSEEINVQPAGSSGGRNYGWNIMEGEVCHDLEHADVCSSDELTPPVFVYHHDEGCAVVGGYVYRGVVIADLEGLYVFGDHCLGYLWTLREHDGEWQASLPMETGLNISTFGEDEAGELYVADMDGNVFRIVGR